jgi:hypothetical protein
MSETKNSRTAGSAKANRIAQYVAKLEQDMATMRANDRANNMRGMVVRSLTGAVESTSHVSGVC